MENINIYSYSVIYTVESKDPKDYYPYDMEDWKITEDHESEYIDEYHHIKMIALLTPEKFNKFIDDCGLYAENIETMGSLGAPGYGLGWSPAISFNGEVYDAWLNAYVTPNITEEEADKHLKQTRLNEEDAGDYIWKKIREQILEKWGY